MYRAWGRLLTDQVRRDLRLIALPTSNGRSIARQPRDIRRDPPRLVGGKHDLGQRRGRRDE